MLSLLSFVARQIISQIGIIFFMYKMRKNLIPLGINLYYIFLVMDDENPKEVTADAIVTVTVTLIRRNMSTLFGDETVKEVTQIIENGLDEGKEEGGEAVEIATTKRPAWMKQKKGGDISFEKVHCLFEH